MDITGIPTGAEAKLLGELIGLARGTDGSEHLITPELTEVVAAGLSARGGDALMEALREKALHAKREIVPGCFACDHPCGRTAPYDLSRLAKEPEETRQKKLKLLTAARELADSDRDAGKDRLLYQALIAIGIEEIDPQTLSGLMNTMG